MSPARRRRQSAALALGRGQGQCYVRAGKRCAARYRSRVWESPRRPAESLANQPRTGLWPSSLGGASAICKSHFRCRCRPGVMTCRASWSPWSPFPSALVRDRLRENEWRRSDGGYADLASMEISSNDKCSRDQAIQRANGGTDVRACAGNPGIGKRLGVDRVNAATIHVSSDRGRGRLQHGHPNTLKCGNRSDRHYKTSSSPASHRNTFTLRQ